MIRLLLATLALLLVDAPTWRWSSGNLPQAERGSKSGLLKWPRRGQAIAALLRRHQVDVMGAQEVGPRTLRALRAVRGLGLLLARANTVRGRFRVMNGHFVNLATFEVLHRRLIVAWNRYGPRFIPVLLLADTHTGDRVISIAGHADRKRPHAEPGKRVLRVMAREGARLHRRTGVPVVVTMDSNNAPAALEIFADRDYVVLARNGIDLIFGLGVERVGKPLILNGFRGTVTDHANPPAADVRPTTRNTRLDRLPKLSRPARRALARIRRLDRRRNRR